MRRFRYEYGDNPVHLVVGVVSLAVGAWALYKAIGLLGIPVNFVKWFAGSIVIHDLVFLPIYAAIGVLVTAAMTGGSHSRLRIAALNHLRVPALLAGLAFVVWFPLILRKAPGSFEHLTGYANDFYLGRWLALCAVLFGVSAIAFLLRIRTLRRSA